MTPRIKPLTGQCLLEMLPPKDAIESGPFKGYQTLAIPSKYQAKPTRGVVRAIGPWPALKNGMRLLPEFGLGAIVWVPNAVGQKLTRDVGEKYKLVRVKDVLLLETS